MLLVQHKKLMLMCFCHPSYYYYYSLSHCCLGDTCALCFGTTHPIIWGLWGDVNRKYNVTMEAAGELASGLQFEPLLLAHICLLFGQISTIESTPN